MVLGVHPVMYQGTLFTRGICASLLVRMAGIVCRSVGGACIRQLQFACVTGDVLSCEFSLPIVSEMHALYNLTHVVILRCYDLLCLTNTLLQGILIGCRYSRSLYQGTLSRGLCISTLV